MKNPNMLAPAARCAFGAGAAGEGRRGTWAREPYRVDVLACGERRGAPGRGRLTSRTLAEAYKQSLTETVSGPLRLSGDRSLRETVSGYESRSQGSAVSGWLL
jgi:hypothetical protein